MWSIARFTKCAVPLITLSIVQHLTNYTIFRQSCSALAIGFRVNVRNRLRVRVSFIASVVVDKTNICIKRVRLGLARIRLGLGCAIGQMRSAF